MRRRLQGSKRSLGERGFRPLKKRARNLQRARPNLVAAAATEGLSAPSLLETPAALAGPAVGQFENARF